MEKGKWKNLKERREYKTKEPAHKPMTHHNFLFLCFLPLKLFGSLEGKKYYIKTKLIGINGLKIIFMFRV